MKSLKLPLEDLRREAEKSSQNWEKIVKELEELPHGNEEIEESETLYEEAYKKINH